MVYCLLPNGLVRNLGRYEPIPILGMPLVYVWCSSWGAIWLVGCLYFGLKIDEEDAKNRES